MRSAADPALWPLDPTVTYLNHGAFGSCPHRVLEYQAELRRQMERQPVQFFVRDLEPLLDAVRNELARFLGAEACDIVMVPNATAGINTVLRSLVFERGDELLTTNHEYNASQNAIAYVANRGARLVIAGVPFPIRSSGEIIEAVLRCVTSRTRIALIDHVTSQTGLIFPIQELVRELSARGVETLVDGAHAPGMVTVNLQELGATYYTGNCHKWLCAPKAAGFLHVQRDRQKLIRPLVISHGANSPRQDRSRFLIEFGWTGTSDPSAFLAVPEALRYVGSLLRGGWPEVMQRNHALAIGARAAICQRLGVAPPCPENFIGSIASIPLPDSRDAVPPKSPLYLDPLQETLLRNHRIEVPVIPWPKPPKRLLRISAQLYNDLSQYELLGDALASELSARETPNAS